MTPRQAAFLIMLGAALMSLVGLFVRLIDQADGFQILFYRAISVTLLIALLISIRRRTGIRGIAGSLDRQDAGIGVFLSLAFVFYIFAILNTSVASALFTLTAAPLLAASLAWMWIGERPRPFTWLAMLLAAFGVFVMIGDGFGTGRTLGNVFALLAAMSFALMLVLARRARKTDILGGTLIASALSGIFGLVFSVAVGSGLAVSWHDFWIVTLLGLVAIGPGIACVTWGTPHLPAAEVSLLVLIESALGPVWVWLFGFESITLAECIGGGIIFAAVISLSLMTGRSRLVG